MGQYGTALKHFRLVVEANADPSQALFGRMCCALSELGASTSESVSLAIDAVGPDLYDICLKEMGTVEQTMHQFVSGVLMGSNFYLIVPFYSFSASIIQLSQGVKCFVEFYLLSSLNWKGVEGLLKLIVGCDLLLLCLAKSNPHQSLRYLFVFY